jgi:hypothetical protein
MALVLTMQRFKYLLNYGVQYLLLAIVAQLIILLLFKPISLMGSTNLAFYLGVMLAVLTLLFVFANVAYQGELSRPYTHEPQHDAKLTTEFLDLIAEFERHDFTTIDQPTVMRTSDGKHICALRHRDETTCAIITQIASGKARPLIRLRTSFEGDVDLTTSREPVFACLPLAIGAFHQVLRDAPVADAIRKHRQSVEWLRHEGAKARILTPMTFYEEMRRIRQRDGDWYNENPVWFGILLILRVPRQYTPHGGILAEQRAITKHIDKWKSTQSWYRVSGR